MAVIGYVYYSPHSQVKVFTPSVSQVGSVVTVSVYLWLCGSSVVSSAGVSVAAVVVALVVYSVVAVVELSVDAEVGVTACSVVCEDVSDVFC